MAEVQTWPGSKIKDYCILNAKRMVEKFKRDRPPVMPTGLVDEPGSFAMGGLVGRGPHFARVEHEKVLHMECRADDRRVQERIRTGILGINWCTLVPLLSQAILFRPLICTAKKPLTTCLSQAPCSGIGSCMRRRNSSLTLLSVARMRSRRVVLLTRNCPRLLRSQMKVKPRKLKVSGFPSPR